MQFGMTASMNAQFRLANTATSKGAQTAIGRFNVTIQEALKLAAETGCPMLQVHADEVYLLDGQWRINCKYAVACVALCWIDRNVEDVEKNTHAVHVLTECIVELETELKEEIK
jgi:hypothetical protein